MNGRLGWKYILLCLCSLLLAGCLCSCKGSRAGGEKINVVLTTGFARDEVFQLEDASCRRPELLIYLAAEQSRYEAVYGSQLWTVRKRENLERRLKEKVLAEISQIKAMTLLAARKGIVLTSQEEELAQRAAEEYCGLLSEEETRILEAEPALVREMYRDYALADKVYREIIRDINPEISDDEARTMTVQHILLRTATQNADQTITPYSQAEKENRYRRAQEALEAARRGEAFESLIEKYSDDAQGTLSFGKGEMEAAFEEAAFNLGNGEISGIIETSEGYEIIKCISTFNREETDRNKVKIAERRKDEAFEQEYDAFVESLARSFNQEIWGEIGLVWQEEGHTADFFEVYRNYFREP